MKKIALSLVLAASMGLVACSQAEEAPPQDEALGPEAAAEAIKQAEAAAKAAADKEASLKKQLAAASQIEELAAIVATSAAYSSIKTEAQEKLDKLVNPIINSGDKSWVELDKLMGQLPNSNPRWNDAWTEKERRKEAVKK
jgi:hypothetical protein